MNWSLQAAMELIFPASPPQEHPISIPKKMQAAINMVKFMNTPFIRL
jgi:hypothetical protein